MKRNQKWLILFVALVLMAGTAGALTWLKEHQKLGQPGINGRADSRQRGDEN